MDKKPTLIFKLGDREKGWIPSESHSMALAEVLNNLEITQHFNCLIYHYGIEVTMVGTEEMLDDMKLIKLNDMEYKEFIEKYKDLLVKKSSTNMEECT